MLRTPLSMTVDSSLAARSERSGTGPDMAGWANSVSARSTSSSVTTETVDVLGRLTGPLTTR